MAEKGNGNANGGKSCHKKNINSTTDTGKEAKFAGRE